MLTVTMYNHDNELDAQEAKTSQEATEVLIDMIRASGTIQANDRFVIIGDEEEDDAEVDVYFRRRT